MKPWERVLLCITAAASFLVAPGHASASTSIRTESQTPSHLYQRWIDKSYVPTPVTFVVITDDLSICRNRQVHGCAAVDYATIAVQPLWPKWVERDALMHELGHFFDRLHLSPENRRWLRKAFRFGPWRNQGQAWHRRGEEAFATLYAICAVRPPRNIQTTYNDFGLWKARKIRRGCGYIRRVGARYTDLPAPGQVR